VSDYGSTPPDPNDPPRTPQQPDWSQPSQPPGQPVYGGNPQFSQTPYGAQPYGQPAATPPPNYLVWAILSTLFCCQPLGIPSIVYAARVNAMYEGGNIAGALESSRKAKQFAIWSAASMAVVYALFIVLAVAVGSSSDA